VKQQASTGVAYEGQPNQSKACRSTAGRTASSNWQFSAENWSTSSQIENWSTSRTASSN